MSMLLDVECRPGPYGDPEPHAFHLGGTRIEVLDILDRWPSATCSYYKIRAKDASICILRHIPLRHEWELTLYQSSHHAAG